MAIRYGLLAVLCVFVIVTDAARPSHHVSVGHHDRKGAFLNRVLQHYRQAICGSLKPAESKAECLMCTNEHNFACTVDLKNKHTNLMCIDFAWRCDGRPDCPMGEDELDCEPEECGESEIRCCDTGECATPCNDKVECAWGEDELNCEAQDHDCTGRLKCPNGICADPCDGIYTCPDGRDENECNIGTGCRIGEYKCSSPPGVNVTCATPCDGKGECSSNVDESECGVDVCEDNRIPCLTIQEGSIAHICAKLCDHHVECEDARDEQKEFCRQCIACETIEPTDVCVFADECPSPI